MNNYANWELTQLLPQINPYGTDYHWIKPYPDSSFEKLTLAYHSKLSANQLCIERNAWTWEEIRLYLESKGFNINYKHNLFNDKVSWSVCVNNMTNRVFSTENIEQDSYQQAREEAIKWCLNYVETSNN